MFMYFHNVYIGSLLTLLQCQEQFTTHLFEQIHLSAPSGDTWRLTCSVATPQWTKCYHPCLQFDKPILTYGNYGMLQVPITYLLFLGYWVIFWKVDRYYGRRHMAFLYFVTVKFQLSCVFLQYLVHFMKSLYEWLDRRCTRRFPIAPTAWALLCDSYHGNLCLSHRPDVIAVAVLHMSLQCYGISVPPQDREDTRLQWWQVTHPIVTQVPFLMSCLYCTDHLLIFSLRELCASFFLCFIAKTLFLCSLLSWTIYRPLWPDL